MTTARSNGAPAVSRRTVGVKWRQLERYPSTGPRAVYLGVVIAATIVLYYELYIGGAVGGQILSDLGMSFRYFILINILSNAAGAAASLAAGLADRWGRANLVVGGLLVSGLLMLVGLPSANTKLEFLVLFMLLGIVEGVTLVATPALIRDFSPQLGRASAMGFWTMGPLVGSVIVTEVSSHTLAAHPSWQYQFRLCGVVGLVVFAIALLALRELSPQLRDQLMVSTRDKTLVEARAAGLDPERALSGHWRQMMRMDVIGSAVAVSMLLLFYYVAVAYLALYFELTFGYSAARANAVANWLWISMAIALVITGALSDLLKVRKPFMVVGGALSATGVALFARFTTQPSTHYHAFAGTFVLIGIGLGIAYSTWMAGFTETIERHNPAATATGLAVWASILRVVVVVSLAGFLVIVSAANELAEHGTRVSTLATTYSTQLTTLAKIDPSTLAVLQKHPADTAAQTAALSDLTKLPVGEIGKIERFTSEHAAELTTLQTIDPATRHTLGADATNKHATATAIHEIATKMHLSRSAATQRLEAANQLPRAQLQDSVAHGPAVQKAAAQLTAAGKVPAADLGYLQKHSGPVQQAAKDSPKQWQRWWWIAFAGQLIFLPFIFVMTGRWSPRKARQDAATHQAAVEAELAALTATTASDH